MTEKKYSIHEVEKVEKERERLQEDIQNEREELHQDKLSRLEYQAEKQIDLIGKLNVLIRNANINDDQDTSFENEVYRKQIKLAAKRLDYISAQMEYTQRKMMDKKRKNGN